MRRRRPDEDELLPLELDDDGAAPDGQLVEIGVGGPRRRWRDGAVVLAVVAIVAAIGLLGDDGTADQAGAEAETSTTVPRRRPATTRVPRSTTTTLAEDVVEVTPGTGPVVAGPTGSVVVVSDGDDEIVMVDLDTGERCRVRRRLNGAWFPRADAPLLRTDRGTVGLRPGCVLEGHSLRQDVELVAADRPGHVWSFSYQSFGLHLEEVGPDDTPTGRRIDVPFPPGMFHPVTGGVVLDVHGSATFVDADTTEAREVGRGAVLAARGERVALLECEAFDCSVALRDLGGRLHGRVDSPAALAPYAGGALSPDGRHLAVLAVGEDDGPRLRIVDLAGGSSIDGGATNGNPVAFTATGSHVVALSINGLQLHPVGGGDPVRVDDLPTLPQSFAVLPRA